MTFTNREQRTVGHMESDRSGLKAVNGGTQFQVSGHPSWEGAAPLGSTRSVTVAGRETPRLRAMGLTEVLWLDGCIIKPPTESTHLQLDGSPTVSMCSVRW